jgi:hypothetical protein
MYYSKSLGLYVGDNLSFRYFLSFSFFFLSAPDSSRRSVVLP